MWNQLTWIQPNRFESTKFLLISQQKMIEFLEDLQVYRESLLREIEAAPEQVLTTLYQRQGRQISSPYIPIDEDWLCCYMQAQGCPSQPGPDGTLVEVNIGGLPFWLKRVTVTSVAVEYRTQIPPGWRKFPSSCGFRLEPNLVLVGSDAFTHEFLVSLFLDNFYTPSTIIPILLTYAITLCHPVAQPAVPDPEAYFPATVPTPLQGFGRDEPGSILAGSTAFLGQTPRTISIYRTSQPSGINGLFLRQAPNLGSLVDLPYSKELADHRVITRVRHRSGTMSTYELIQPPTMQQILNQLLVTLYRLQSNLQFQHGHLTADKIWLSREAVDTDMYGIVLILDFTCKLTDFSRASLTQYLGPNHQPHRFYQRVPQLETVNSARPEFTPIIGDYAGEPYYRINNDFTGAILDRWSYLGYPFYATIDTYTLMVSLLLIPQFHYTIMTDDQLRQTFWEPLWFPVDINLMYNRIVDQLARGTTTSYDDVIDLIRGVRLKCQVTRDLLRANGGTV